MAYVTYRFTIKSQEQRGASQPNIVEIDLNSDSDALIFAANLAGCVLGTVVTVDKLVQDNYTLPYPAGTDFTLRLAATDGNGNWYNTHIYDVPSAFTPVTRSTALLALDPVFFNNVGTQFTATSLNVTVFHPGPSVGDV